MENNKNGNEELKAFVNSLKKTVFSGIMLGYEIGKMQSNFGYKTLVEFLKGDITNCYSFDTLKPLYDKFGYETTNKAIIQLYEIYEKKEQNENE